MAGIIEKKARLEFTLKQAGDEISDGKYNWISAKKCVKNV